MSAPTSKDSLFSGLRWGYLQGGEERRRSKLVWWEMGQASSDSFLVNICLTIRRDNTWEGPVFVQETPRFWWSLFLGCRCRGGKEGWSQGPSLWAQLASWKGCGKMERKEVTAGKTSDSLYSVRSIRLLSRTSKACQIKMQPCGLMISILVVGLVIKTQCWEWSPV